MPNIEWMIRGPELVSCNCAYGCPCQFNALPTNGNCHAAVAIHIEDGRFGDETLAGLRLAMTAAWPGPIHEGYGAVQPIVDEAADARQREALLAIMAGQHAEPGATIFAIIASMAETIHPPMFKPIAFAVDLENCTGRFAVPGVVEAEAQPIRDPVTGAPHFVKLSLRQSFEFAEAEFASSTVKASDPIALDWSGRHAHLAMLHLTGKGIVH